MTGEPANNDAAEQAEDAYQKLSDDFISALAPIFLPEDPRKPDILDYFCSLLRTGGIEDAGWDPYAESRTMLHELYALVKLDLPAERFSDPDKSRFRIALLFYSHVVEMDAPYEVIANLLRYRLDLGYSLSPFFDFLTNRQKKSFAKIGIYPSQKIEIVTDLAERAGLQIGPIFDSFYDNDLRNAIAHSSFVLTDEHLVCRSAKLGKSFRMPLTELDDKVTRAKAFIGAFFALEEEARRQCGEAAGRPMAYDPHYKGVMEVLANENGLMDGFKVHWPNGSDSWYRRTPKGADQVNAILQARRPAVDLFVGLYARNPGRFSPLVEDGEEPTYTPLETGEPTVWTP